MPKANVSITIKCEGAKAYAEQIEAYVNKLFDTVEWKPGEEMTITVSDDFSKEQ